MWPSLQHTHSRKQAHLFRGAAGHAAGSTSLTPDVDDPAEEGTGGDDHAPAQHALPCSHWTPQLVERLQDWLCIDCMSPASCSAAAASVQKVTVKTVPDVTLGAAEDAHLACKCMQTASASQSRCHCTGTCS